MQAANSILPVNAALPESACDVPPYVKATQRVSSSEQDALQLCRERLSKKNQAIFDRFVQLYQVENPADFTRERLLELRGCGERSAKEILKGIQNVTKTE